MITRVTEINCDLLEGRLLMAAIAKMWDEQLTDKTPDELLAECNEVAENMFNKFGVPKIKFTTE
jgi:hypothetical protein